MKTVVIDKGIEGWEEDNREKLLDTYTEIIQVGRHEKLTERTDDKEIAAYCRAKDYDLITADTKFYEHYFENGDNELKITKIDWWNKKYILLIEIMN